MDAGDNKFEEPQRTSTFAQINVESLRLMKILDDYHCYFLHKIDIPADVGDDQMNER